MRSELLNDEMLATLSSLPHKVSAPLVDLLEREHLSPTALATILDASALSGQKHKLVGFAVAYHHLKMQGVEVDDVIRMAKRRGRRINLGWRPKRWKMEHETLSRAETLSRLAEDNVQFDVSEYARHLAERFPGYLIQSSRRLGMEGLRQRHCVASYCTSLTRGYMALAAVFVDKQRWTVQLGLNQDPDCPVRISQVKGRFNRSAPEDVVQHIHALLGVKQAMRSSSPRPSVEAEDRLEERIHSNLAAVLPALRGSGVEQVVVRFDGYGDSGTIDAALCRFPGDGPYDLQSLPDTPRVPSMTYRSFYENGAYRATRESQDVSLSDAFQRIVEDYLDRSGVDWYNNEGGFGEFTLDVETGCCRLTVETRIQESEIAFDDEIMIDPDCQNAA